MITPARRLTQASQTGVNFSRSRLTPLLSVSHQAAEPRKTPSTINAALLKFPAVSPSRSPAKMAMNDRMVSGLVMVRNKVVR